MVVPHLNIDFIHFWKSRGISRSRGSCNKAKVVSNKDFQLIRFWNNRARKEKVKKPKKRDQKKQKKNFFFDKSKKKHRNNVFMKKKKASTIWKRMITNMDMYTLKLKELNATELKFKRWKCAFWTRRKTK